MDLNLLLHTSIFEGIDRDTLQLFINNNPYAHRKYNPSQYIAIQGSPCNSIYILYKGYVRTSMTNPNGKEIVFEDILAPDILAPAFIYSISNLFPVNAKALTECELLVLNKDSFFAFMQKNAIILYNFLRILSQKILLLTKKINSFALLDLRGRLANYLLNNNNIETQQQIADKLAVARPSLSRVLSELENEGCIKIERCNIQILDKLKLKHYIIDI